jgi:hypothetical protein
MTITCPGHLSEDRCPHCGQVARVRPTPEQAAWLAAYDKWQDEDQRAVSA